MAEPVKELINVIGVDPSSQMPYLAQVSGDTTSNGGLLWYIFQGDELGIFPPLIFMGVGALTDFGPLIANPRVYF